MLCPNCMSAYIKNFEPDPDAAALPEEPMFECTECSYVGTVTEFVPENYR
ncbi:MAG: hypothetical protein JHC87_01020 [Thermoleophilaceae bacterium]|nr:hypothetical protein [Thermoleophilaceae bacterium]